MLTKCTICGAHVPHTNAVGAQCSAECAVQQQQLDALAAARSAFEAAMPTEARALLWARQAFRQLSWPQGGAR